MGVHHYRGTIGPMLIVFFVCSNICFPFAKALGTFPALCPLAICACKIISAEILERAFRNSCGLSAAETMSSSNCMIASIRILFVKVSYWTA